MTDEEQRKAFASYMGTASGTTGEQAPHNIGTFASAGNPYSLPFPNVQGLPAAPTPPPAVAPSSVASFPSYQGNYHAGYPAGAAPGAYMQNSFPRRPPPLGESEVLPSQRSMMSPGNPQVSSKHGSRLSFPSHGHNGTWQYSDPMTQQNIQLDSGAMPHMGAESAQASNQNVPVLLCHMCSVCGRTRSAGYHRHNPVIPSKPLVLTPCRKCKKKLDSQRRPVSRYTRVRSCTAEHPCDWPCDRAHVEAEPYERRGRRRSREEVRTYRYSPSRPRIIRQSSSQARLGVGVLQHDPSPRHVWPLPDGVCPTSSRVIESQRRHRGSPHLTSSDEVWPPPDVVRLRSYTKIATSPPRRTSSRIIELSPSPPAPRTRFTKDVYRNESRERCFRDPSPVRIRSRLQRSFEDAEARIMAHPRAYRPVWADSHSFARASEREYCEDSAQVETNGPSVFRSSGRGHEAIRGRATVRESQESTAVEVGSPRVRFHSDRASEQSNRNRPLFEDDARPVTEYKAYHDYSRHRHVDDPPLDPPFVDNIDTQTPYPSSRRVPTEHNGLDRSRRTSPSPPRQRRDIHIRHVSSLNLDDTRRAPRFAASPPPGAHHASSAYRYVYRPRFPSRTRSVTPKSASEDMTDSNSDSAQSVERTEMRGWKGIDEDGRRAVFVEERRGRRLLEQGSDVSGQEGVRGSRLSDEVAAAGRGRGRRWRDV